MSMNLDKGSRLSDKGCIYHSSQVSRQGVSLINVKYVIVLLNMLVLCRILNEFGQLIL